MAFVLIATPSSDGRVTGRYLRSVARLLRDADLAREGVHIHDPEVVEGALVAHARNAFASRLLEHSEATHLLFIDADIGFDPRAVRRLLEWDKPLAGALYPSRRLDPKLAHAVARDITDPALARSVGQNYVASDALMRDVTAEGTTGLSIQAGFARTHQLGMGLTLIRRDVFETMAARRSDLTAPANGYYRSIGVRERVLQCFESEKGPDGVYISEDVAFCRRWTRDGEGEIWALLDEPLTHSGLTDFTGTAIDRLRYDHWAKTRA